MMLKKKNGYKRAWFWIGLLIVGGVFVLSRLEGAKMRYKKNRFAASIAKVQGVKPTFKTKSLNHKSIHVLQLISKEESTLASERRPLVVLVHGSPGSLAAYEKYLKDEAIFAQADIIAVDRLGFGYSDFGKTEPSLMVQANLIAEVLKDFEDREIILVGHSMGCPVISKLAMEYPALVDGLLYVAPAISPELEPSNTWRKIVNFPLFRFFTPPALRVCNQEIIPLKDELEKMTDKWENINVPTTVIQGTRDNLVSPANADFAEKVLVNSPLVKKVSVQDGNHFILWSEIPLIKKELLSLLNKVAIP